nr:phosphopantetheine-binding protein [Streptomyces sp. 150FB]
MFKRGSGVDHAARPESEQGRPLASVQDSVRNSLPNSVSHSVPHSTEHARDRETVDVISEIWCEVLDLPEVGIEDNFFDAGGHSILLRLVQDRVWQRLGRRIELIDLFNHPTVFSLARHLESGPVPTDTVGGGAGRGTTRRVRGAGLLGRRRGQLGGQDVAGSPVAGEEFDD